MRLLLGLQAAVLEGDSGRRADRGEQLGLVLERRVVHQRRHARAVAIDQASSRARALRPGSSTGRPSRSAQLSNSGSQYASVSDGSRSERARASRRSPGAGFERSSTNRSPTAERASRASAARSGRRSGETDHEQRRALDRREGRPVEARREEQHRDHHQPEGERVDQQRRRIAAAAGRRAAAASPARRCRRGSRADRDELHALDRLRRSGRGETSSRLSGPKPPSAIFTSWSPIARHVAAPTSAALEPASADVRQGRPGRRAGRGRPAGGRRPPRPCTEPRSWRTPARRAPVAKPPATISRPSRLSGRRHQAIRPADDVRDADPLEQRDLDAADGVVRQRERQSGPRGRQPGGRDRPHHRETRRLTGSRDRDWCCVGRSHAAPFRSSEGEDTPHRT